MVREKRRVVNVQVSQAHMQRYKDVRELEEWVTKERKHNYNKEDLKKLRVRTFQMESDPNREPTFRPCFFQPYKGDLNAEPHDEEREAAGWKWDPYYEDEDSDPIDWATDTHGYYVEYMRAQYVENEAKGSKLPEVWMMPYGLFISLLSLSSF